MLSEVVTASGIEVESPKRVERSVAGLVAESPARRGRHNHFNFLVNLKSSCVKHYGEQLDIANHNIVNYLRMKITILRNACRQII